MRFLSDHGLMYLAFAVLDLAVAMPSLIQQIQHFRVSLLKLTQDAYISDSPKFPHRTGKINHLNKFDATFFGFNFEKAESMDPQGRISLEKAYEAIVDAGME